MAQCDQCGNNYENSFTVISHGTEYHFDCFECAIQKLAPECGHCSCRVIGHGVESENSIYCCAHCAREAGIQGVVDNVEQAPQAAAAVS